LEKARRRVFAKKKENCGVPQTLLNKEENKGLVGGAKNGHFADHRGQRGLGRGGKIRIPVATGGMKKKATNHRFLVGEKSGTKYKKGGGVETGD